MKIAIWGSGAIGGAVGAAMAAAGEDVLMVDVVPEHVEAMNRHGLVVKSAAGELRAAVRAALPREVRGSFDFVFLAVKSQFTGDALDAIVPHLGPGSAVVSLQNGVNEPRIAQRIGAQRTIGCLVDFSADYLAAGEILRARAGNLFIGELDGALSPRLDAVRRLLEHSTRTHVCANILGFVWAKICKATLDANTALVDTNALELRADRTYHPLRIQLLREGIRVAAASGVRVEAFAHFDPAPFLDRSAAGVAAAFAVLDDMARGQAHNNTRVRTGYWRDIVVRKRKTEIEYVTGEIVHGGERLGVPTPLNRLQLRMFEEIERGTRAMGWENLAAMASALRELDVPELLQERSSAR
ncbi:MAG: ketopantoate reductase family protein [Burkholderiales bacterium]|nr:ketopantoate reductase family protein [Burkholderiales bacterium]